MTNARRFPMSSAATGKLRRLTGRAAIGRSAPNPLQRAGPLAGGLILRGLDTFALGSPRSREARATDRAFRASREAELRGRFDALAQGGLPMSHVTLELHRTLNHGKKFPLRVRLGSLLVHQELKAGAYRTGSNRAGAYLAPSAKDVPRLMEQLTGRLDTELSRPLTGPEARALAAWALTMMIRIHPFYDGVGRTARAMVNVILVRAGQPPLDFPTDSDANWRSPIGEGIADLMREFTGPQGLGWTLNEGPIPPRGYFDELGRQLTAEAGVATATSLTRDPKIAAIARALETIEPFPRVPRASPPAH